jgi:hypothetical protein
MESHERVSKPFTSYFRYWTHSMANSWFTVSRQSYQIHSFDSPDCSWTMADGRQASFWTHRCSSFLTQRTKFGGTALNISRLKAAKHHSCMHTPCCKVVAAVLAVLNFFFLFHNLTAPCRNSPAISISDLPLHRDFRLKIRSATNTCCP